MDKFFLVLCFIIVSAMIASFNTFKQHSHANTVESVKVMLKTNVSRSPAIVKNK